MNYVAEANGWKTQTQSFKNGCFYIFGSLGCVVKRDEESMSVIAA
jgi:hypothetical protein